MLLDGTDKACLEPAPALQVAEMQDIEFLWPTGMTRPSMPDSTQINPSDYPDAELEGTPAAAWAPAPAAAAPEAAEASAAASLQVISCSPSGHPDTGCQCCPKTSWSNQACPGHHTLFSGGLLIDSKQLIWPY